ncbi:MULTISPECIES: 4-hydroxyphenylacetate catabolism regulatory protein HpaA [unclassified Neptuniibacter]|uniref:4-hydroxyphenylacetate catabolism regulatory protein HpaA n=1 Tax=unclassified Neptuniibacter TaxID=2630693 RepID=UPI000C65A413|nr:MULTISPECIES: 4-hydroxyphenylacetate catabolism regulatory protein HpaA [unclassified Neptuniibacter]MAY43287.1 4-hydroxyphenylacetate catabolism regulatory protein HpaA [Oceanospirillaceae bacterium]|tara:strand:+ start:14264 stop:15196 length:933 start_codon:yes stop_codon:yes gene_type:complete
MSRNSSPPNQSTSISDDIPNIDIGHAYDQHYVDADIHYEHLEKLADFFGRNMPVHHHDRFYQLHVILNGTVRVHLDETSYIVEGPMFFLTPPTIPHAFVTDNNATGHVITARQQLVWELMGGMVPTGWGSSSFMNSPLCVALSPKADVNAERMLHLLSLMADENKHSNMEHAVALKALLQLVLIDISRLSDQNQPQQKTRKEDVRIFHRFNELIETHYREHLTLSQYSDIIGVTEARLNEICRRLAGQPSKRLIMDRLTQEARRLLTFSSTTITEISYQLGFKDPAYFARFFRRNAGATATEYREEKNKT